MSLQQIQEELNAPKDLYNKFAGFKYRSAESILQALKPLLAKHKYSLVISDSLELIGDRYYVKATSSLYDDKMTLIAQSSAYAREELILKGQQSSQITGGTSSYARKYSLNGLFLIDDAEDADSHDNTKITITPKISEDNVLTIQGLITQTNTELDKFLGAYKVAKITDLDKIQAESAITLLTKKLTKAS